MNEHKKCPHGVRSMRIVDEIDASGPLDGNKIIYTVELERGKYADVMYCSNTGLLYVMQLEGGERVFDERRDPVDYGLDEAAVIAFVRKEKQIGT